MPRIPMTDENKKQTSESYPSLKYKTGEKGRVCFIETEPNVIYVHEHRMPVVINGEIQKELKKGKNGDYEKDKTEYAGKYACDGRYEVVAKEGTDPEQCTQCKWAIEHPSMFSLPKRRFGLHVLKYKTIPGTSTVANPFSAELVLYQFTDFKFDALVDLQKEHKDLRVKDLTVNCINGEMNNFDFQIGGSCEWIADDSRKAYVKELLSSNMAEDVDALLARKATKTDLAMTLDKVQGRWSLVGKTGPSASTLGGETFDNLNMDNMFAGTTATEAPAWATEAPAVPTETPAVPTESSWAEAGAGHVPAGDPVPSEDVLEEDVKQGEDSLASLDDFLAGFGKG